MIIGILFILLSFTWLLYETDFLRIRLESTEYQKNEALQSKTKGIETGSDTIAPIETESPENIEPYRPPVFTPLDMPALTGTLNIICKRGEL